MRRTVAVILAAVLGLYLFGCTHQSGPVEGSVGNLCSITSDFGMAETETGFYLCVCGYMHYADKADLTKWVPLCNKPNCTHYIGSPGCDALTFGGGFYLKDGRIYYCDSDSSFGGSDTLAIVSMSAKGGDRRVEHLIDTPPREQVIQWRTCFLEDRMMLFCSCMDQEGLFHNYVIQITPEGDQILAEGRTDAMPPFLGTVTASEDVFGDPAILYNLDGTGFGTILYRLTETGLEPIGDTAGLGLGYLADLDMMGAYLTGDVLQVYKPNDGYYDINLATGEETKTMEVQMADAWSWHLNDQCILESPLLANHPWAEHELAPGPQTMLLYDGTSWQPVALPEELAQASGDDCLILFAVTSDRVIFQLTQYTAAGSDIQLYQMMLNEKEWKLTSMATISMENR